MTATLPTTPASPSSPSTSETAAAPGIPPLAASGAATRRRPRAGSVVRLVLHRVLDAVIVLWVAATITFLAIKAIPGDPADRMLAGLWDVTEEDYARVRALWGFDQPVWQQYLSYLGRLVQGDLGESYLRGAPVSQILGQELPATLYLTTVAMVLAAGLVLVLVPFTAGRGRITRSLATAVELVTIAMPAFWIGILLLIVFSFTFPIFPSFGADKPLSIVLPAAALAISMFGVISQVLRERVEHTLHEPFVTSVRARGVSETGVRARHVVRHAALPALTISGIIYGSLLTGTAVIETLFARPGIGSIAVSAVQERDLPVVIGVVIFSSLAFVVINTIVDLVYRALDPRLKES